MDVVLPEHLFRAERDARVRALTERVQQELRDRPDDYDAIAWNARWELAEIKGDIENKRRQPLAKDHPQYEALKKHTAAMPEYWRRHVFGAEAVDAEQLRRENDDLKAELERRSTGGTDEGTGVGAVGA